MVTGFSYDTKTGNWFADYTTKDNKYYFKQLYSNSFGYFIKQGMRHIYLTGEQTEQFIKQRNETLKQLSIKP